MQKIMFNDKYGLTKAVLDRIKTQTRRIPDIQPPYENSEICFPTDFLLDDEPEKHPLWMAYCWKNKDNPEEFTPWVKPMYKEGETVAVAQSYKTIDDFYKAAFPYNHSVHGMTISEFYGVSDEDVRKWNMIAVNYRGKKVWTNKLFVKPELMLHFLRITKVRMQRLQDISEEDCLKEGINKLVPGDGIPRYRVMDRNGERMYSTDDYKDAYRFLINGTSGKGTWEKNPNVWVYDFELIK